MFDVDDVGANRINVNDNNSLKTRLQTFPRGRALERAQHNFTLN